MMAKLNVFLWRPLPTLFINLLQQICSGRQILHWYRNKTGFYSYFYLIFCISPGTLLPDLIYFVMHFESRTTHKDPEHADDNNQQ
jgi:hypothetical protein